MTAPVDLRSDTVTRPTAAMRAAMASAKVGDDVFGDDPSVLALQARVAALLGKEAALFVPSGTMANQLALRAHTNHGDALLAHARCHIHAWEGGGPAALAGVTTRTMDSTDGLLDPDWVRRNLALADDPHLSPARVLALENTHNACGGVVLDPAGVSELCELAHAHGVATHLDGARLWNAAAASGATPAALATGFDTVSVCFSKGLGAPIGSALAGSAALIRRAHRFRKMYGGGMRQAGILAAAALHALDHHVERLADDHRRAALFVRACAELPGLFVDIASTQTNLVYVGVIGSALPVPPRDAADTIQARLLRRGVLVTGNELGFRAVFHLDVDNEGTERAMAALRDAVYEG